MVEDKKGQIWVGNNTGGITIIDPRQALDFGQPDGFYRFQPDSLYQNKLPPPVVFTDFKVFEKTHPFDKNINSKKKNIFLVTF